MTCNETERKLKIEDEDIDIDRVFVCVKEDERTKKYVLGERYKIIDKVEYCSAEQTYNGKTKYVYTLETESGHDSASVTPLLMRLCSYKENSTKETVQFVPLRKLDPELEFMLRLSGRL